MCLCGAAFTAAASDYDDRRAAAVQACETIDPAAYQTGLLFNPNGHRSFYVQAQCLQKEAVRFRDDALCERVRQRRSLFWSSWAYSRSRCRELVVAGIASDREVLEGLRERYRKGAMRFSDFRIERNGNGRDFDILPMFAGDYAHGYTLQFEIVDATAAGAPIVLHAGGYYVDARSALNIYVPRAELSRRAPEFVFGRSYRVRATLVLEVGNGGQSGYWSDAFIEQVFPLRERSSSMTKEVDL